MANLLKETLEILKEHGKTPRDVEWVGSKEWGWFTWEDFEKIADIEYDNGYGAQEIAEDLLVVGKDWWLTREEYDGSEWWQFNQIPQKPKEYRVPPYLSVGQVNLIGWKSLIEINEGGIK